MKDIIRAEISLTAVRVIILIAIFLGLVVLLFGCSAPIAPDSASTNVARPAGTPGVSNVEFEFNRSRYRKKPKHVWKKAKTSAPVNR